MFDRYGWMKPWSDPRLQQGYQPDPYIVREGGQPRICKDCHFYRAVTLHPSLGPKCYHPASEGEVNLVDGWTRHKYCKEMRETICGPEGKLFTSC